MLRALRGVLPLLGAGLFVTSVLAACGSDEPPVVAPPGGKAGAAGGAGAAGSAGVAGKAGGSGAAGKAGASGSAGGVSCAVDCSIGVATDPPGCAEAACVNGFCALQAKDADGDGQRSNKCKAIATGVTIAVGTDCNDGNATVFVGAWDGPADGAKPNRCDDGIDQNCSGADGDDKTANGTSCTCTPGDVSACKEDDGGKAIAFPDGPLVGACKLGSKTCLVDAITKKAYFGPCTGAKGPVAEACDGVDNDCNGKVDDAVTGAALWVYDGDKDGRAAYGFATKTSCAKPNAVPAECTDAYAKAKCGAQATPASCCPGDRWILGDAGVLRDDCEDGDASIPGKPCQSAGVGACIGTGTVVCTKEVAACNAVQGSPKDEAGFGCNGKDDDCDGVVDEAPWQADASGAEHPGGRCFVKLEGGFPDFNPNLNGVTALDPPGTTCGNASFKCTTFGYTTLRQCAGASGDRIYASSPVDGHLAVDFQPDPAEPRRAQMVARLVVREASGDATSGCATMVASSALADRPIKRVLLRNHAGTFDAGYAGYAGLVSKAPAMSNAATDPPAQMDVPMALKEGASEIPTSVRYQVRFDPHLPAAGDNGVDLCTADNQGCPPASATTDFYVRPTLLNTQAKQAELWVELIPPP